jgi:hypothetical protein
MYKLNENLKVFSYTLDKTDPLNPKYVQNNDYLMPIDDVILMPNSLYGGLTFFLLCGTVLLSSFTYNNIKDYYKTPNDDEKNKKELIFLKSLEDNYHKINNNK